MPPVVEKLWTNCAGYFASIKRADEVFLEGKTTEILTNWGVDPAAMQRRAVRNLQLSAIFASFLDPLLLFFHTIDAQKKNCPTCLNHLGPGSDTAVPYALVLFA